MKITRKYLQRIIKEEISKVLQERDDPWAGRGEYSPIKCPGEFVETSGDPKVVAQIFAAMNPELWRSVVRNNDGHPDSPSAAGIGALGAPKSHQQRDHVLRAFNKCPAFKALGTDKFLDVWNHLRDFRLAPSPDEDPEGFEKWASDILGRTNARL